MYNTFLNKGSAFRVRRVNANKNEFLKPGVC